MKTGRRDAKKFASWGLAYCFFDLPVLNYAVIWDKAVFLKKAVCFIQFVPSCAEGRGMCKK